jgi:hypothetical protein
VASITTRWKRSAGALLFLAGFCAGVRAGEAADDGDRIVTDRPDVVESSRVVGKGRFQLETSVDYERDSRDGAKTRTFATPTLFRLGVAERLELRVETDGYARQRTEDAGAIQTDRGWADASIGAKWEMQKGNDSGRPGIGWLLHADLDSGSREFRGDGVRPSLRVVFEWELPRDYSFGVMPGIRRDKDPETGQRFTAGILAAVLGKELSARSRVFVEVAASQIASREHGGTIATIDIGTAYLVTNRMQVDLAARIGANSDSPEFALTAGFSIKF